MNMFPKRLAQQQKKRWKSFTGPFSSTSRSHRVDTAYLSKIAMKREQLSQMLFPDGDKKGSVATHHTKFTSKIQNNKAYCFFLRRAALLALRREKPLVDSWSLGEVEEGLSPSLTPPPVFPFRPSSLSPPGRDKLL
jgi:hypothetical protein